MLSFRLHAELKDATGRFAGTPLKSPTEEKGLAKIAGAATMPENDSNHTVFVPVIEHLSQKATRKSFASGSTAGP
jgi:hypothetical protein